MLGFGLDIALRGSMSSPPFNPLSLAPNAWYDPSDLASMFQDSAGTTPAAVNSPVGKINDKSGNGNHAVQATGASRPTLRQSGALYYLEFDGTDDYLATAVLGAALTQPIAIAHAAKLNILSTSKGANQSISDSTAADHRVYMEAGNDNLALYANAAGINISGPLTITNPYVFNVEMNGPSSTARTNGVAGATGNAGSSTLPRIFLGASGTPGNYLQGRIYGTIIRQGLFSASEKTKVEAYLAAKAGVTI